MRIDYPIWSLGGDNTGHRIIGVRRPKPVCPPGSTLCVIVDYLHNVTGVLTVVDVAVTDCYTNDAGETVIILADAIYGKILGLRFHCVPKRQNAADIGQPQGDLQPTNYSESAQANAEELAESFGVEDACCCEECE